MSDNKSSGNRSGYPTEDTLDKSQDSSHREQGERQSTKELENKTDPAEDTLDKSQDSSRREPGERQETKELETQTDPTEHTLDKSQDSSDREPRESQETKELDTQTEESVRKFQNPPVPQGSKRPTSLVGSSSNQTALVKLEPPPSFPRRRQSPSAIPVIRTRVESKSTAHQTTSTGAIPKTGQTRKQLPDCKEPKSASKECSLSQEGSSEVSPDKHLLVAPDVKSRKSSSRSPCKLVHAISNLIKKSPGEKSSKNKNSKSAKDSAEQKSDKKREGSTLEHPSPKIKLPKEATISGAPIDVTFDFGKDFAKDSDSVKSLSTQETTDGLVTPLTRLSTSSVQSIEFDDKNLEEGERDEEFATFESDDDKNKEPKDDKNEEPQEKMNEDS